MSERTITAVTSRSAHRRNALRFTLDSDHALAMEPRRALALMRALGATGRNNLGALFRYAGVNPDLESIGSVECRALASALRRAGYPLDNAGVSRFKFERGFSSVVRIGPAVAEAYVRHARGIDTRLAIAADAWAALAVDKRRAAQLLLLMSHVPGELERVYGALGLPTASVGVSEPGVACVDLAAVEAWVAWCAQYDIKFSDNGLRQVVSACQRSSRAAPRSMAPLARFLARVVTAPEEPEHHYTRLAASSDNVVSRRILAMLRAAEQSLPAGMRLHVIRGSYVSEPAKGAHPHNGGGVVDLTPSLATPDSLVRAIVALRRAGFAAWYRRRSATPHIHAVAIGDRELNAAALWQVMSYFHGRDGRSHSGPDPHARIAVCPPEWSLKYAIRHG